MIFVYFAAEMVSFFFQSAGQNCATICATALVDKNLCARLPIGANFLPVGNLESTRLFYCYQRPRRIFASRIPRQPQFDRNSHRSSASTVARRQSHTLDADSRFVLRLVGLYIAVLSAF